MADPIASEQVYPSVDFWTSRLDINASSAVYHQWEQLEQTGCIDNFRITVGMKKGFREGFFFADSDAYKWLEAVSLIYSTLRDPQLKQLIDDFIAVLEQAQEEDGYLYTYNQVHFSSCRWDTLQIGHEFYCLGHLIEAGISHHEATGEESLFRVAMRAADLLVERFMDAEPLYIDGHEEIEIALVRLSRHTGKPVYRELARRLVDRRGKIRLFGLHFLTQFLRITGRMNTVSALRRHYYRDHAGVVRASLPEHNRHKIPAFIPLRFVVSALSGKYTQQHAPLRRQVSPEGHAVRFAYLNTAATMIARDEQDDSLGQHLEKLWSAMASRRMYVTGGIGSLPLIEGFGRDYELDPETAYAETCAALGCMQWNHEMSRFTGNPKYEDLFEWQLYNAASVGMGLEGTSYFYNNPLASRGGLKREPWYDIPCCPSNLSRAWAALPQKVFTRTGNILTLHQFISGEYTPDEGIWIKLESALPWSGDMAIRFSIIQSAALNLRLRVPAWADDCQVTLNGRRVGLDEEHADSAPVDSAVDLHFEKSCYGILREGLRDGDEVRITYAMPVVARRQDARIKNCGGRSAFTRGPLVFCLETPDNQTNIFDTVVDTKTVVARFDPVLLGGTTVLEGYSLKGEPLKWIPYLLWGNRGESRMTVFCNTA